MNGKQIEAAKMKVTPTSKPKVAGKVTTKAVPKKPIVKKSAVVSRVAPKPWIKK